MTEVTNQARSESNPEVYDEHSIAARREGPRSRQDLNGRPERRFGELAVVALVVVAAAVAIAAFFVGHDFRSAAQLAARARPPQPSVVTAPVELVRPRTQVVLRGTLTYGSSTTIRSPTGLGGSLPVVTASTLRVGDRVSSGTVVAAVAGRPVIALAGRVPAYDDMAYGSTGVDVSELQRDLAVLGLSTGTDTSGWYGTGTAEAVAKLYDRLGYSPNLQPATLPTGSAAHKRPRVERLATLPLGEVVFLSSLPATAVHVAPLGANIGPGGVAQLATGALTIRATTDENTAPLTHVGQLGRATSDEKPGSFRLRLIAIRRAPGQNGNGPTASLTFAPISPRAASVFLGENLALHVELGGGDQPRLVVPAAAVFTQADGRSDVILVRGGTRTAVPVVPGISYAGKEVVTAHRGGLLRPGERVVIGI